jgi:hypothetical protein
VEETSLRIQTFDLMLTMVTDKHRSTMALIVSVIRDTCKQGLTLQDFRNGKDIGRRGSVHSTYGLDEL